MKNDSLPSVEQRLRSLRRAAATVQLFASLWVLISLFGIAACVMEGEYNAAFINFMGGVAAALVCLLGGIIHRVFRDDLLEVAAWARASAMRPDT